MFKNKKRIDNIENALWLGGYIWGKNPEYSAPTWNRKRIDDLEEKVKAQGYIIGAILEHFELEAKLYKEERVVIKKIRGGEERDAT